MSALPILAAAPAGAVESSSARRRDLLRFITCGSVDDGKSTLIGRLLHDSGHLFEDQLEALARDSARMGTQGGALDLALALDGLAAEREQGITIDVAYRYFSTARRSFIVADTPGHEEYTRNMATGASTADAAILLVDVRKGVTTQTRRHAVLVAMLGIRHVALAVNKMDLAGFAREPYEAVMVEARRLADALGLGLTGVPIAALTGDNVAARSAAMPWHQGPHLLEWLETLAVGEEETGSLRLAVQSVSRPDSSFRGYAGLVTGGPAWPGQAVTVYPSGKATRIARIVTYDGDLDLALPGQSVTLTLADEVDVSRGCVIAAGPAPAVTGRVSARLFWMAPEPLRPGASYLAKIGTQLVPATVTAIAGRIALEPLGEEPAAALGPNDVGDVALVFDRPVVVEPYRDSRDLGGLILIERESFATVALGLVQKAAAGPGESEEREAAPAPREAAAWLAVPFAAPWRSILKTVTWRLLGTFLTVLVAYALTRNLRLALVLGGIEILAKFVLYFGHERLWARIGLGLRALPSASGR
ncbi:GTP-binding protein [Enterovirga sp.]|uniref:GTP-binding protein n=1 Tax=Enterovirga sp. TaxID=2026350 RepID=UPI002C9C3221|nr:GTP-binding protein [Enterovirga sp.]HMO29209.1 GTP-binding protein [Enterovirga sp.]